ncbi:hypothetical protein DFQ28_010487 [Apophysomyces sp. BC1034]|nr:hypothetical protein DFQ30_000808 [Apophysomyces sp. BC1015]KAG0191961.1 hypothetical protein DFQ28_010487 [Apophysomyces sp. BC1034]
MDSTLAAWMGSAFHTASRESQRQPGSRTGHRAFTPGVLAAAMAVSAMLLGGCVATYPPTTRTVLSQLPEQRSHAPMTLTPEEKQRYDEIGRQVLREQNAAMQAQALARVWSRYPYAVTPVYGSWGPGWGVSSRWSYPNGW